MTLSSQRKHLFLTIFILSRTSDNTTSQNIGGTNAWAAPHLKFLGGTVPPVYPSLGLHPCTGGLSSIAVSCARRRLAVKGMRTFHHRSDDHGTVHHRGLFITADRRPIHHTTINHWTIHPSNCQLIGHYLDKCFLIRRIK